MIDKKHIGMRFPIHQATVEVGQLRFFAKATGETNPVYIDQAAAEAANHPALPVPPAFLFSMELSRPASNWREDMGIELARVLHGEQSFTYHRMAYAGDVLSFDCHVADIYQKKGGALDFMVRETRVTNQRGEHVADLCGVLVQRNG